MKASVLVLTYNHERYVAEAIDSVLMQETDFEFEVVVSEDCSTDETPGIVARYEKRHPDRIRVRNSERNLGAARSLAVTFQQCRGDYVALLEGDDYWTSPEKLQKQADFLDRHPECSMCGHGLLEIQEGSDAPPVAWMLPWQKEVSTLEDLILHNFVHTGSAMLRRDVFAGFPSWVYEAPFSDYPLWMQAAHHGDIGFIKEFLGVYRIHENGAWSSKDRRAQVSDLIAFYERMRGEVGPGYDRVFERVLARCRGQLACELAGIPWDADVLVASGGDPELLKVRPRARHFPPPGGSADVARMRRRNLAQLLGHAQGDGAEYLLIPQTVLASLPRDGGLRRVRRGRTDLLRDLDASHPRVWDSAHAIIYQLSDQGAAG